MKNPQIPSFHPGCQTSSHVGGLPSLKKTRKDSAKNQTSSMERTIIDIIIVSGKNLSALYHMVRALQLQLCKTAKII
jgi:hypothetical protein